MIVANIKTLKEILDLIGDRTRLLIAGCEACVTVCHAGGEKEVEILASKLKLSAMTTGHNLTIKTFMLQRQCDREFIEEFRHETTDFQLIISLACGAGAQTLSEMIPDCTVVPGLNTTFLGAHHQNTQWEERCSGCGECVIHLYGGFCPITRCAKSLLNGPCGGSIDGECETNPEVDCIWNKIIERMMTNEQMEQLMQFQKPKDWQKSQSGGLRSHNLEE